MRQIVADDVPFVKESLTKDEAIARFMDMGCRRRSNFSTRILEIEKDTVLFFGRVQRFLRQMVPSADI